MDYPLLYRTMPNQAKYVKQIKRLQTLLKAQGLNVSVDGIFGAGTESAVVKFQESVSGLKNDGKAGNGTWTILEGRKAFFDNYHKDLGIPTTDYFLENDEYYPEIVEKDTVYLHHTAGGGNAYFVTQSWEYDKDKRGEALEVATAFIIARKSRSRNPEFNCEEGELFRAFDEKYWAHHLGTSFRNNTQLNKKSIGIEICSYGGLKKNSKGHFITAYGNTIPSNEVYDHGTKWRGYRYWHKYSDEQIETLRKLLLSLKEKFNLTYQEKFDETFFNYRQEPIDGAPGIWTHVNVRKDKTDCFPQPELLDMLNSLKDK